MQWFFLILAGLLEVAWALGLKYSQGFTKFLPSVFTIFGMVLSFYFLSLSLKDLPMGNAYAIWTRIGTVGTVILGILIFKEPVSITRLICIGFIIIGIVGLKLVSPH